MIDRMLAGEIWYSRKVTSRVILEQQRYRSHTEAAEVMLTVREKEIAIASGAANSDIAGEKNLDAEKHWGRQTVQAGSQPCFA